MPIASMKSYEDGLRKRAVLGALCATLLCACGHDERLSACGGPIPREALRKTSTDGKSWILPNGRRLAPAGIHAKIGGFPAQVVINPDAPVAYVANTGYARRSVQVVDLNDGSLVQEIARAEAFYGLALDSTPGKRRLYASGGNSQLLEVYAVADGGKLSAEGQVQIGGYPAGIALSEDGKRLWVGRFLGNAIVEVDTETLAVENEISLPVRAFNLLHVPVRNELWVAAFGDRNIVVIDLGSNTVAANIDVGGNPLGLAASKLGDRVFAAVSDGDVILSIDTATRKLVGSAPAGEPTVRGEDGSVLPASSPTALALDDEDGLLFVTRAADNAVSVLSPSTLETLGSIPVGWYPTGIDVKSARLVVTNGKGVGAGPLTQYAAWAGTGKEQMTGSVSILPLAGLDLKRLSAQVEANVMRPSQVYPFHCNEPFPIPTKPEDKSPIEHIVLIARENKTYDALLSDLDAGDRDPSLLMFGKDITPNLHALAKIFTNHDNFYDDSESSTQGHDWLTAAFVNDYTERTWLEDYRGNPGFGTDPPLERGQPGFGTFFTHLLKHGVSFTDFGEVVGALGEYGGQKVVDHADLDFPGLAFDLDIKDEEKARHVAGVLVDQGKFPAFSFVLLPDDHTYGTSPGHLTPEAMVNDNDYATGLLVDRISHSPYWEKTAIFIVEDDSQIGGDHVDYHRSICVVVSPWAKRGHLSSVHTSIPSLLRTFELILALPPMNRFDALATPFWDAFSTHPDKTPYTAIPRAVPDDTNPPDGPGAALSAHMDFRGPDRNPDLGPVLEWARKGTPPAGYSAAERLKRLVQRATNSEHDETEGEADDAEEGARSDAARALLERYHMQHPERRANPPAQRAPEPDADP